MMKIMPAKDPATPLTWQQIFELLDATWGMEDVSIPRDEPPQQREFFDDHAPAERRR